MADCPCADLERQLRDSPTLSTLPMAAKYLWLGLARAAAQEGGAIRARPWQGLPATIAMLVGCAEGEVAIPLAMLAQVGAIQVGEQQVTVGAALAAPAAVAPPAPAALVTPAARLRRTRAPGAARGGRPRKGETADQAAARRAGNLGNQENLHGNLENLPVQVSERLDNGTETDGNGGNPLISADFTGAEDSAGENLAGNLETSEVSAEVFLVSEVSSCARSIDSSLSLSGSDSPNTSPSALEEVGESGNQAREVSAEVSGQPLEAPPMRPAPSRTTPEKLARSLLKLACMSDEGCATRTVERWLNEGIPAQTVYEAVQDWCFRQPDDREPPRLLRFFDRMVRELNEMRRGKVPTQEDRLELRRQKREFGELSLTGAFRIHEVRNREQMRIALVHAHLRLLCGDKELPGFVDRDHYRECYEAFKAGAPLFSAQEREEEPTWVAA